MEYGWAWFWSVIASSAGGGAIVGGALYLGRAKLSHWLNKDIEAVKAKHQRDLEAYKVTLIAEAERAKASQDVRKAMAVRLAERKFDAIDKLHQSIAAQASAAVAALRVYANSDQPTRFAAAVELVKSVHGASVAATLADPFFDPPDRLSLHTFCSEISSAIDRLKLPATALAGQELDRVCDDLLRKQSECNRIIERQFSKMLAMD